MGSGTLWIFALPLLYGLVGVYEAPQPVGPDPVALGIGPYPSVVGDLGYDILTPLNSAPAQLLAKFKFRRYSYFNMMFITVLIQQEEEEVRPVVYEAPHYVEAA